jgi:hypothetical protein
MILVVTIGMCPTSLSGVDSMSNYEQVIRQVHYHNWHPAQTPDRKFRLTCSELNGRYTSNEFTLEVSGLESGTIKIQELQCSCASRNYN